MNLTINNFNKLISDFVDTFNNDIKQHDYNWYQLMGNTVGGSEIASILGISPYSSFYKIVQSKIDICNGREKINVGLSCWWGTFFEDIIKNYIEIELGNVVKGDKICIQKYEGHRNSPDGYTIVNFYYKNGKYNIWTTNMSPSLIKLSLIILLEFKCPITRQPTGNIPNYYIPQLLSGLSVSPIAHKGLFIDSLFKKCSISQLGYNDEYDKSFHKKNLIKQYPLAWGVVNLYIPIQKLSNEIINIYQNYFNIKFTEDNDNIIDMGNINLSLFNSIFSLINNNTINITKTTIKFNDGRGDKNILNLKKKEKNILFAVFPWKLFDVSYVFIDREPNYLENVYPTIQRVHKLVKENLHDKDITCNKIKIIDLFDVIY